MNKNNKDMLWWWILGLSDLAIHSKIGEIEYNDEIGKCNDEVFKMHPIQPNQEVQNNRDGLI